MDENYYDVLQVSETADQEVIAFAYKALARKYHPDQNGSAQDAEERMKQINRAYAVLSDSRRRQEYDEDRNIQAATIVRPNQGGSRMPYSAEISRLHPSCFLFVLDQSGSMQDQLGDGSGRTKAQGVSDAINRLLRDLTIKCAKNEGVRDYYHVGVIGYGERVASAFIGPLANRDLVPISEVANCPARIEERTRKIEDGAGGLIDQKVKFPVWFDPVAGSGTPMCSAFSHAKAVLSTWLEHYSNSFPPLVIHITDGASTDGDPLIAMQDVTRLQTNDGNCLLFNLHLSSDGSNAMAFPDSAPQIPYAQLLFNTASVLTPFMQKVARQMGFAVSEASRGFVLNGDLSLIVQALDIGTRPDNLR